MCLIHLDSCFNDPQDRPQSCCLAVQLCLSGMQIAGNDATLTLAALAATDMSMVCHGR